MQYIQRHYVPFLRIFPTGFLGVLMRHELIAVFVQGVVLGNNNPKIIMDNYGLIPNITSKG